MTKRFPNRPVSGTRHRASDRGFSLLELLVVLVLLALVAVAVLLFHRANGPSLRVLGLALAAELNSARATAIAKDQPVEVTIEETGQGYRAGNARRVVLPETVRLSFESSQTLVKGNAEPRLLFFADGSSSGGLFRLVGSGQAVDIRVDWMSGAISIGDR